MNRPEPRKPFVDIKCEVRQVWWRLYRVSASVHIVRGDIDRPEVSNVRPFLVWGRRAANEWYADFAAAIMVLTGATESYALEVKPLPC